MWKFTVGAVLLLGVNSDIAPAPQFLFLVFGRPAGSTGSARLVPAAGFGHKPLSIRRRS
jgi:hypothetical protein